MTHKIHIIVFVLLSKLCYGQYGNLVFLTEGNLCDNRPYQVIFEDNFEVPYLDTIKWRTYYPYGENESDQCSFCRTHSTDSNQEGQIYRDENIRLDEGLLYIDVKKENSNWYQFHKKYTSGMIQSKQAFTDFAKFEIKCIVPSGTGLWPAFWQFGWSTEIDVFEFYELGDQYETSVHHWENTAESYHEWVYAGRDLTRDYHIYAAEYDFHLVKFYLDNKLVNVMPKYFHHNGDPVLNCEIKSGYYFENDEYPVYGNPLNVIANIATFDFESDEMRVPEVSMIIDYIKVYERGIPAAALEEPIASDPVVDKTTKSDKTTRVVLSQDSWEETLTIKSQKLIDKVVITDMSGYEVLSKDINSYEALIDISMLKYTSYNIKVYYSYTLYDQMSFIKQY